MIQLYFFILFLALRFGYTITVLFATQMHELAQYIVDIMNEDANEYLRS